LLQLFLNFALSAASSRRCAFAVWTLLGEIWSAKLPEKGEIPDRLVKQPQLASPLDNPILFSG